MDHHTLVDSGGRTWRALVPAGRRERMRGLLGRTGLDADEALFLPRTRCIHTFGMRFAILVAWVDDDGLVLAVRSVRPRRVALPRPGARHVIELCERADLRVGDRFEPLRRSTHRDRSRAR